MTSFKEFLISQEDRLRAEKLAHAEAWRKWAKSTLSLVEQIEVWIKESDPHTLVTLDRDIVGDIDEDGNLRKDYNLLARLNIQLGDRAVIIRPTARDILGPRWKPGEGQWLGRADMMVIGEPERYQLFRFISGTESEDWYIRDLTTYVMTLLNRESFDHALVSLFS